MAFDSIPFFRICAAVLLLTLPTLYFWPTDHVADNTVAPESVAASNQTFSENGAAVDLPLPLQFDLDLLEKIEQQLDSHQLLDQAITIRMTGCPNGCARPYLAEIGLVGKAPGRFNLHLGAAFDGTRLNRMLLENANEVEILATLDSLFKEYGDNRKTGENFGDYFMRTLKESPTEEQADV